MKVRNHATGAHATRGLRVATALLIITAFAVKAIAASPSTPVQPAAATTAASNQPDIFVLVYAGMYGQDSVAITYPVAVPHTQAKSDLQALATNTGWSPTHVKIEDARAPITGSKQLMTSIEFVAHNIISVQNRYLPLEPVITALKAYPHVAITYMVGDGYSFEGLRQYDDKYVSIALDARGAAYTYHVRIHDPSFQRLNLPLYQMPSTPTKTASAPVHPRVRPWEVMLILLLACVAGVSVYFVMARNAPA